MDEDRHQRVNRELNELLGELRVALPGVQVLFGFLLASAFQPGFATLSPVLRVVFYATLLCSAVSVVLLVAPAAQHRLLFRKQDKEPMLFRFNRFAITGLLCLGLALSGALLLVAAILFGIVAGIVTAAVVAVLIASLWLVRPLQHRRTGADL